MFQASQRYKTMLYFLFLLKRNIIILSITNLSKIFLFLGNIKNQEFQGIIGYYIPSKEICWGKVVVKFIPV